MSGGVQCLLPSRHLRVFCNRLRREHAWAPRSHPERVQLILTWQGRYHDHEGGSPIARLSHCTEAVADPCEFPKCGNLDCRISGSGGLRSRSPLIMLSKRNKSHECLHSVAHCSPSQVLQRYVSSKDHANAHAVYCIVLICYFESVIKHSFIHSFI